MNNKIKLFCFPYAGGSAVVYYKWRALLQSYIELVPIELAGRGSRINEPLYKDVDEMIDNVYAEIKRQAAGSVYALFGHSMGAMIVFELMKRIDTDNFTPPVDIFMSGRNAPNTPSTSGEKIYLLKDELFKDVVIKLGGTPSEFFEHPELTKLYLPILKNDFRLSHIPISDKDYVIRQPINVFLGKSDLMTLNCERWRNFTSHQCTIRFFEGGHFFVNSEYEQVVDSINKSLYYSQRTSLN